MSWEEVRLSEISNMIKRGISPKYIEDGGLPIINQKCIRNNVVSLEFSRRCSNEKLISEEKLIKVGDVLVNSTGTGTLGRTGWIKELTEPTTVDTHVTIVRPNQILVSDKFIALYLSLKENEIETMGKGATNQTELSASILGTLKINLPPLETQKRIASILSTYDDLIENNLKRIKLLEETAQNIYKEWFINFRFPNYEHTEFDAESGLPVGWEKLELNNVADVLSSKRVFLSDYVESGIPFYRGKEITQKSNFLEISELYYISQEKFLELESKLGSPNIGDILITGVGTIGNSYLVNEFDEKFYFKDGNLLWIKNIDEKISSEYLIQYFKSIEFSGVVNSISIGSSQKALTINALKSIKIIVPEEKLIEDFSNNIKVVLRQINLLFEQLKKLKEARDILLPRLMNRTIEV